MNKINSSGLFAIFEKQYFLGNEYRKMKSMLFHRLALSKDKKGVFELSHQGLEVQKEA